MFFFFIFVFVIVIPNLMYVRCYRLPNASLNTYEIEAKKKETKDTKKHARCDVLAGMYVAIGHLRH